MTRIQLTTFLAHDLSDSVQKTNRLSKYVETPGGSDYYWGLKHAAKKIFVEGISFDEAVGVMSNMTVDHQRVDNQAALKNIYDWKLKHKGIGLEKIPSGEIAGPTGDLVVKLEPTFAIGVGKRREAYVLWTYKDLRLTRAVAGIGVHLLESGLKSGKFADWHFYVLDVVTGERFGHGCVRKDTPDAAAFALRTQEELLVAMKKKKSA